MQPTRLYVKEHGVTGMRYFGKTTVALIESYSGSGKYWKKHIKKHGKQINTIWTSKWFTDETEIQDFALAFSELFDIVESNDWANLKLENGLDGGGPGPRLFGDDNPSKRPDVRKKISEALMGHPGVKSKGSTGYPAHNKNKQVWNDGVSQKYTETCPGDGWIAGELASTKLKKSLIPRPKGIEHPNHGRVKTIEEVDKIREKTRKHYKITFPDGTTKLIHGLLDFCREHNLDTAGAHRVLNGTQKTYKQYKFERVADVS